MLHIARLLLPALAALASSGLSAQIAIHGLSGFLNAPSGSSLLGGQLATPINTQGHMAFNAGHNIDLSSVYLADQAVSVTYEVPGRVMADRILLVLGLRREIAREVDYQQSVIPTLHPSIRAQLMQLSQQRLNKVQAVWDNLAGPCQPVPFKNRTLRITADVLYKDPMSGVGLMEAVNGVVNLANVPSWEIEGKVKTSKLIYRK